MSAPGWALLVVAIVLALGLWAWSIANRLDRLHVRTDLSWLALDAALRRRTAVARTMIGAVPTIDAPSIDAPTVAQRADAADRAARDERESAENSLTAALAALTREMTGNSRDRAVLLELNDAQERVIIAKRFFNDAVADTLALRQQWHVQLFRLGGTAPMPRYFEIVEPLP